MRRVCFSTSWFFGCNCCKVVAAVRCLVEEVRVQASWEHLAPGLAGSCRLPRRAWALGQSEDPRGTPTARGPVAPCPAAGHAGAVANARKASSLPNALEVEERLRCIAIARLSSLESLQTYLTQILRQTGLDRLETRRIISDIKLQRNMSTHFSFHSHS